tara:strand:+ start:91 stop:339 length:249 start_codon:yes stop_codon:yes gene_type:complete
LVRLEICKKQSTTFHRLHNSAIDIWRESGVPIDVLLAWSGHHLPSAQDQVYGDGLRLMPDTTAKELVKVDWNGLTFKCQVIT